MMNHTQLCIMLESMSIVELQQLAEAINLMIEKKMHQKTTPKSNNPIVNEILKRSSSNDPQLLDEFIMRFGYIPQGSGYHDTNPNNPFKDYNKSAPNGYHDTNPNNPFKDYNKSSQMSGGYHDTNPNNPFKDYNKSIDD